MWKYILISCPFTYSLSLHFIFTCFINKQILYHFFFILYQFHFIYFTSKMNIYQKISQIHSKPLPINSTNDSEQYWFLDNFVKMLCTSSLLFFFYHSFTIDWWVYKLLSSIVYLTTQIMISIFFHIEIVWDE